MSFFWLHNNEAQPGYSKGLKWYNIFIENLNSMYKWKYKACFTPHTKAACIYFGGHNIIHIARESSSCLSMVPIFAVRNVLNRAENVGNTQ